MMGKTQRTSGGSSTGFVVDYRHVVETMGEYEGLGSSGRVDERAASDDSCAPKRKCISLNVDSFVPMQVISLSKFSAIKKKELETRLKAELEQIQMLQKRLYMLPRSDGMMRQGNVLGSSDILAGQGKKRGPSGENYHSMKRGNHGKFQNKDVSTASISNSKLMKQCEQLLKRLMAHPYGWVFNTPVDIVQLNIPDYFTHIKHPMDLGTVKSKIAKGEYSSPLGFLADTRLTFSNAMTYNPPGHDVHTMAGQLRTFFEARWKAIEKKLPANESVSVPMQLDAARDTIAAKSIPPSKKMKISSPGHERIMTDKEKFKLTEDLQNISDFPPNLIEFVRKLSTGQTADDELVLDIENMSGDTLFTLIRKQSTVQTADDELELDIENMSGDTLFTLKKLVDDYMQDQQENQRKVVPCITENMDVSGNRGSSTQPGKGNDLVDEDVDIGGNDPPASIYPPMEIDKDAAHKSSKCSSSSGSSSDSGSSSSDSNSGSDSDRARASCPARAKKLMGSGEALLYQQANGVGDPHDGNQHVSGLDQVEQCSLPKPPSVEVDSRQEGESAPPERQVSPDKLYRAALLRNRFADTILKAREKTLNQCEKGDPEKLRHKREELEKHQREEKARLQAEAKAAEDARRKADAEAAAEAAAEAKRKRDLEREAARQALLEMEKTVEINESSQFLEDLEMLRGPAVHIPSSVDETSQEHSSDGLGCFNFQSSSNPLEQLGLFMKLDDEDEEEVPNNLPEPPTSPPPTPPTVQPDVEEGEID